MKMRFEVEFDLMVKALHNCIEGGNLENALRNVEEICKVIKLNLGED